MRYLILNVENLHGLYIYHFSKLQDRISVVLFRQSGLDFGSYKIQAKLQENLTILIQYSGNTLKLK